MGQSSIFKKITGKVLGLIVLGCIVVAGLMTYLYVMEIFANQTVFVIVCSACLIIIMMVMNHLAARFVAKKYAAKNSNPKYFKLDNFDSLNDILLSNNAKVNTFDFGKNYLIVKGTNAFRVCIVENNDLYFNRETKEKSNGDKRLEKCTKFCGFEIFKSTTEDVTRKIELFTFQSENVCYAGFYFDNDKLVQANYEDIKDCHKDNYNFMLNTLNLKEIKEETN